MPEVRLLANGAGRYEVKQGELFICTDEEFARWAPAGVVELAGAERASAEPKADAEVEAAVEPPRPAPARRSRKTSG